MMYVHMISTKLDMNVEKNCAAKYKVMRSGHTVHRMKDVDQMSMKTS